jgi:hypothetical protein
MPSDELEQLLKRIKALEERVAALETPAQPAPPPTYGEDEGLVGAYVP